MRERFPKAHFLREQRFGDAIFRSAQLGIGLAHLHVEVGDKLVKERFGLAEFVAVAQRAANDSAQHVTATFVRWNHAVGDEECACANVVGNHAKRRIVHLLAAGLARSRVDERNEYVDFVVRVNVLQNRGEALHTHAGVNRRFRQRQHRAVFDLAVELHEHEVPNLDEAVAVFVRRARWAASDVRAVVVENF